MLEIPTTSWAHQQKSPTFTCIIMQQHYNFDSLKNKQSYDKLAISNKFQFKLIFKFHIIFIFTLAQMDAVAPWEEDNHLNTYV